MYFQDNNQVRGEAGTEIAEMRTNEGLGCKALRYHRRKDNFQHSAAQNKGNFLRKKVSAQRKQKGRKMNRLQTPNQQKLK